MRKLYTFNEVLKVIEYYRPRLVDKVFTQNPYSVIKEIEVKEHGPDQYEIGCKAVVEGGSIILVGTLHKFAETLEMNSP